MFVPFDPAVRVHVGVVTLGAPDRMRACLEALVAHRSEHDFVVSLLVNPGTMSDQPTPERLPEGVHVERAGSNLGWAGGLHRLRALSDAELFAWVQDDMTPQPGWLDALIAAAEAHPRVGCFGALRVDEDDKVLLYSGGAAEPPDRVDGWNATDTTAERRPTEVTVLDWVTSKGCLTRTAAFDEVSGPDPRLWPLNHVDKDYCTHLRSHGWDVALVPGARLLHQGSQSAPSAFREFLREWRDSWFDDRWSATLAALAGRTSAPVPHPCAEWRAVVVDPVEAVSGQAATRMLVPFARHRAVAEKAAAAAAQEAAEREAQLRQRVAQVEQALVAAEQRRRMQRRRLRRQLRASRARLAEVESSPGYRLTAPLRRFAGRLR